MAASYWSLFLSFVATAVAVAAFARVFWRELPIVEFLVKRNPSGGYLYQLAVSNPTHRLLVLEHVEVFSPAASGVGFPLLRDDLHGTVERAYEDSSSESPRTKSVFLAVPAEQTESIGIEFVDDEDFKVDFRLRWSKALPRPVGWFMPRRVELTSAQVKSRKIAAVPECRDRVSA